MTQIYSNPNYCLGNRSTLEKFRIALSILANPWMLLFDKIGLIKKPHYKTYTGLNFVSRGGTTDVNDAVVVMSGREYPDKILGLKGLNNPVILDCGGHIGSFSLYIKSHYPSAKIVVMEPVQANIDLLKHNIALNDLQNITIIDKALYGQAGTYYIDLAGKQFDAVHVTPTKPIHDEFITIEALTFKDVITQNNLAKIDLMKLDVEGAEYNIFQHSTDTISNTVKQLIMEFHPAGDILKRNEVVRQLCEVGTFELVYETKNILGFSNRQLT